ncbi:hypothetical protein [Lacrimispora xylanolytica]|uniref:Replication restart DNA helicase PriA n=1 Tax=Lacrimispora xylanolytica TaxID=29375 RepID=A0ABY7AE21_9FIRM|nr:hypothetical protein [Lacrimispora xylanolytica]WAJ24033.1 hypothetical protein OW255_00445 [Lacrimispora xylanolytica]
MKIRVSMPEASVAIDFEEGKALEVFGKLNEVLLAMKKKGKVSVPEEIIIPIKAVVKPEVKIPPKQNYEVIQKPVANPMPDSVIAELDAKIPSLDTPKYKGFMYIKCPVCGKEKGLCMKKEADHYHCDSCGKRSEFEKPLVPLFVNCECGRRFKYLTNMMESLFDINCLDCGAPVAVKWNEDKQIYETIR